MADTKISALPAASTINSPDLIPIVQGGVNYKLTFAELLTAIGTDGDYIAALTGDVAATGPGVVTATIQPNVVTNAKLAQMAADTIKGNNTGSTANAMDLTVAQVNLILPVFTSSLNGLAPLSGGGTTNFLRADGTWATPPAGTGTVTSVSLADSTGIFNTTGSPVTTSGTLTLSSLKSQTANTFLAAPNGSSGAPTFRAIVSADIPTLNQNTTGTSANTTATSNSTLTTLSALTTAMSLSSVGTIAFGIWNGTTISVQYGGTGDTSFAAYSIIAGGTTPTGPLQTVSGVGTAGQVLTSNGASALPTWQAATGGVSSLNSLTGALNILAGSNITVTPSGSGITIAASGSGDVIGPGTSIARQIPVFSGTDGLTLTNSLAEVDSSGDILAGDNGTLANPAFSWVGTPSTGFLLDPTQGGSTNALVTSIQGQQAVVINLNTGNGVPYSQHNFRVLFQDGSQYDPALGFFNNGGLGWFHDAVNSIMTTIGSVPTIAFRANGIDIVNVGSGLSVAEGSNARQGISTLTSGTVTVSNTTVTANTRIFLTAQALGTVSVPQALAITARTPGTSFTITSAGVTDTSIVAWEMFEPA